MKKEIQFEEFLKERLDPLYIQSAENSFDRVMERIHKRKRRKILFLFLTGTLSFLSLVWYKVEPGKILAAAKSDMTKKNSPVQTNSSEPVQQMNTRTSTHPQNPTLFSEGNVEPGLISERGNKLETARRGDNVASGSETVNPPAESQQTSSVAYDKLKEDDHFTDAYPNRLINKTVLIPDSEHDLYLMSCRETDVLLPKSKIHGSAKLFFGIAYSPQVTKSVFSANAFSGAPEGEKKEYLENRKANNTFKLDRSFSFRVGVLLRLKWQIMLGYGTERFSDDEKASPHAPPLGLAFNTIDMTSFHTNTYQYRQFVLDVDRLFSLGRWARVKLGAGLRIDQSQFARSGGGASSHRPSEILSLVDLRAGIIEDLGRHFQVQLAPHFFGAVNSMLNKNEPVKQRPFGFGLEGLILYRIRN